MNWGYKIMFVYIVFVAGIILLVYKSSTQNTDLVSPDYYEKELKYQQTIDQTKRANALSSEIKHTITGNQITLQFPPEMSNTELKAEILLYCPSNKNNDFRQLFTTQNGLITLPLRAANKGNYELKITWSANGMSYYHEKKIFIE